MTDPTNPENCPVCGLPRVAEKGQYACPGCTIAPPSTNVPRYTHKEVRPEAPPGDAQADPHPKDPTSRPYAKAVQTFLDWRNLQAQAAHADHHHVAAEVRVVALRAVRPWDADSLARAELVLKQARGTARVMADLCASARSEVLEANTALTIALIRAENGSTPEGNA